MVDQRAVAFAAYQVAARPEGGKMIVAVLASHGERSLDASLRLRREAPGAQI
jgi:hypothetical protein